MFYTYILYSENIDRYYVGSSEDPKRRCFFHNIGKAGRKGQRTYTKRAKDWKVVFMRSFLSKSESLKFEKYIKKRKSRKYIENLISGV